MRHKRFLLLSLILFLLCQTNLFGALIAASFGAVILIEAIGFFNETRKVTQWQFGMSLFLLTSGIAVFLYTAYMPRDTVWPWGSRFFVTFSLERLYDTFCNTNRAYFPYLTSAIKKYGGIFYFKEMNFIFSLLEFLF
jgi:hypothetical protein